MVWVLLFPLFFWLVSYTCSLYYSIVLKGTVETGFQCQLKWSFDVVVLKTAILRGWWGGGMCPHAKEKSHSLCWHWKCSSHSMVCPVGAVLGATLCCTGCCQWGWIEDTVLNPSFLVEPVNGNMPSGVWEISEGLLQGRREYSSMRQKAFPCYSWTLHLWNLIAREGSWSPCFLHSVLSSLNNHLIMHVSKPCSVCLQHGFSAFAY